MKRCYNIALWEMKDFRAIMGTKSQVILVSTALILTIRLSPSTSSWMGSNKLFELLYLSYLTYQLFTMVCVWEAACILCVFLFFPCFTYRAYCPPHSWSWALNSPLIHHVHLYQATFTHTIQTAVVLGCMMNAWFQSRWGRMAQETSRHVWSNPLWPCLKIVIVSLTLVHYGKQTVNTWAEHMSQCSFQKNPHYLLNLTLSPSLNLTWT